MTRYTRPSTPPVQENAAPKAEELDWQQIDMASPYALEFRARAVFKPRAHLITAGLLVIASVSAVPVAWALGLVAGIHILRWEYAVGSGFLGLILAAANQLVRIQRPDTIRPTIDATTLFCLVSPFFGWLAAALAGRLADLAGAFLYLAVAMPAMVVAADRIATHAIHWMTANLLVDYATGLQWRRDWAWRFLRAPRLELSEEEAEIPQLRAVFGAVLQARMNYALGFLWVLAGLVLPTAFVLISSRPPNLRTIGLQIVVGIVFGVFGALLLRTGGQLVMVVRFWYMLAHYLHHAKGKKRPPWMFRSPCGSYRQRRIFVVAAVALLSVSLTSLVLHSLVRLASMNPASAEVHQSEHVVGMPGNSTVSTATSPANSIKPPAPLSVHQSVFALVVFSVTIPPLVFLAILAILIGPTIHAYHQALEE